ncbi:MAG: tRNA isopentenyl-2-thiomethyl-A-37 hydroxylase MiaE [Pseudomonadota bacterium]
MSAAAAAACEFLGCRTPAAWVERAPAALPTLLLDHANCEMKAAATALALLHRYPERGRLAQKMSRLAREELRHFEQVQRLIDERRIERRRLSPSRYAARMLAATAAEEPARLRQRLVVGAFIEARSCERFAALAEVVDPGLAAFYGSLLASEARHFQDYLALAESVGGGEAVRADVERWRGIEAELVLTPDSDFRFHSGVPG